MIFSGLPISCKFLLFLCFWVCISKSTHIYHPFLSLLAPFTAPATYHSLTQFSHSFSLIISNISFVFPSIPTSTEATLLLSSLAYQSDLPFISPSSPIIWYILHLFLVDFQEFNDLLDYFFSYSKLLRATFLSSA